MNKEQVSESYELVREENLTDIHSAGYLLRHKKSGARVMLISNDDENKVFSIAFRTTPKDSTGVPHILEHSVLCGSREFPLKDPFVELVKGSLNTFLNAMTYPDKTCYPVASCNDQDFQNLMHVYLDAVFFPNIYQKEEIFRQEGWSYHLDDPDGELTVSGVVYNEMKGVYSSPDDVLEREIMNALFPDTTYGVESGGDPEFIPDLTYEQFLDFHRTYYHPSNSYIYLYGNMDMAEKLDFIDKHYLSKFDMLEVDSAIGEQPAFAACKDISKPYAISENEDTAGQTYLSYNMVTGNVSDSLKCLAFEVLDYALLSAPGAPLKQALLDAKIGKDVYGSFDDGLLQPYFSVIAKGSDPEKKEQFVSIIRDVLGGIVKNGIDQKAVEAGINYMEFRYREADFASYPKGLMYGLDIMGDWLYDDSNPFAQVKQLEVFDALKKAAKEGYFEKLIQEYLLDNPHGAVLSLVPEKGLAARREKALADKLAAYKSSLSREQLEEIVSRTKALEEYQESEEKPEDLECIPMLKRTDIKREAAKLTNDPQTADGSLFLYHPVCTNGIGYVTLLFDLHDLSAEQIHYLGLLKAVLGYVDAGEYTYGELFNEINANTGGIQCGVEVYDEVGDPEKFSVKFSVRGKALYPKLSFLFDMMKKILNESKIEDTKRLYEIIAQAKSRAQASLVSAGHQTAVLRGASYASPMALFQDELSGIGFYQFLETLESDFEDRKDEIVSGLRALMARIFRPENFAADYTGEAESVETVKDLAVSLKKSLCAEAVSDTEAELSCEKKNEGFTTAGQVQYVAQTGNFVKKGYAYTGALDILKVALSYDYLWINLRVKGGAYGCMSGFNRSGESYFVSYRDPHLKETLGVYAGIPEYVRTFKADEREMTKYIIGTISGKDTPRTPQTQGDISRMAYFRGLTQEMLQNERNQILDATVEDIHALAPLIEAVLSDEQICVVGSESAINKDKDVFMDTKPLITC